MGAGGATAYFSGIDFTRFLPRGSWDVHQQPWQGRAGQEVEDLRRLVSADFQLTAHGPNQAALSSEANAVCRLSSCQGTWLVGLPLW